MKDTRSADGTLSTSEAAALLGVKPATLYAYVSRGLIRSEPGPGERDSAGITPGMSRRWRRGNSAGGTWPGPCKVLSRKPLTAPCTGALRYWRVP
ncbi:helix-turn-helix domain-containing protein [Deinococcus malanensis]|uniref:helix-turn-helix domain-containing protein n=1 Tax=Deinococcus malanensis TaxID=1706855 RepID=UPI0036299CBC